MTVSESIIKWLKTFDPEEYWKMKNIDTDMLAAKVDSYSLAKAPVQNVKTYLSGKKIYTEHYTMLARLASETNADRIDNNGFGEALEGWIREQDRMQNYPILANAKVQGISTTTPFHAGKTDTGNSLYQLTIEIEFEKES